MRNRQINSKGSTKTWLIILAVFAVLISAASIFLYKTNRLPFAVTGRQREAIFLTNGQVYFGIIKKENDRYLVISDIYYLKTQDQLSLSNPDKKISIIKLGEEVHGPEDQMYINRDQILFYEPMRDDSKINDAIEKYVVSKSLPK